LLPLAAACCRLLLLLVAITVTLTPPVYPTCAVVRTFFTRQLLYCKKDNMSGRYNLHQQLRLKTTRVEDVESRLGFRHQFHILNPYKSFIVYAESAQVKQVRHCTERSTHPTNQRSKSLSPSSHHRRFVQEWIRDIRQAIKQAAHVSVARGVASVAPTQTNNSKQVRLESLASIKCASIKCFYQMRFYQMLLSNAASIKCCFYQMLLLSNAASIKCFYQMLLLSNAASINNSSRLVSALPVS
jgi:hypothetical protein